MVLDGVVVVFLDTFLLTFLGCNFFFNTFTSKDKVLLLGASTLEKTVDADVD